MSSKCQQAWLLIFLSCCCCLLSNTQSTPLLRHEAAATLMTAAAHHQPQHHQHHKHSSNKHLPSSTAPWSLNSYGGTYEQQPAAAVPTTSTTLAASIAESRQHCGQHASIGQLVKNSPIILKALGARIFTDNDFNVMSVVLDDDDVDVVVRNGIAAKSAVAAALAHSNAAGQKPAGVNSNRAETLGRSSILITLTPETIYKGTSLLKMTPSGESTNRKYHSSTDFGQGNSPNSNNNNNNNYDASYLSEGQLNATLQPASCYDGNLIDNLPTDVIVFGKLVSQQQLQQRRQQLHLPAASAGSIDDKQNDMLSISVNGLHRWTPQFENHIWRHLGWDDWSDFTVCSVTCGKGVQQRFRRCLLDNPSVLARNMNLNRGANKAQNDSDEQNDELQESALEQTPYEHHWQQQLQAEDDDYIDQLAAEAAAAVQQHAAKKSQHKPEIMLAKQSAVLATAAAAAAAGDEMSEVKNVAKTDRNQLNLHAKAFAKPKHVTTNRQQQQRLSSMKSGKTLSGKFNFVASSAAADELGQHGSLAAGSSSRNSNPADDVLKMPRTMPGDNYENYDDSMPADAVAAAEADASDVEDEDAEEEQEFEELGNDSLYMRVFEGTHNLQNDDNNNKIDYDYHSSTNNEPLNQIKNVKPQHGGKAKRSASWEPTAPTPTRSKKKRKAVKKSISTMSCEGYNIEQRNCNLFECEDDISDLLKFYKKYPLSEDVASLSLPSAAAAATNDVNVAAMSAATNGAAATQSAAAASLSSSSSLVATTIQQQQQQQQTTTTMNSTSAAISYVAQPLPQHLQQQGSHQQSSTPSNMGFIGKWRNALNYTLMLTFRLKNDSLSRTSTIFSIRNSTQNLYLEVGKDGLRLYMERDGTSEMLPVKFNLYDYHWHQVAISIQNGDFISIYVDCYRISSFVVARRLYSLPLDADVEIGRGFYGEIQQLLVLPENHEHQQCSHKHTPINEVKRYIIDTFIDDYAN